MPVRASPIYGTIQGIGTTGNRVLIENYGTVPVMPSDSAGTIESSGTIGNPPTVFVTFCFCLSSQLVFLRRRGSQ